MAGPGPSDEEPKVLRGACLWEGSILPKDPFVCPKSPGLPRSIPILFGWDWNPKNPIRSGGVGGFFHVSQITSHRIHI